MLLMKGKTSILWSKYIIDGLTYNASPGEMLESACGRDCHKKEHSDFEPIVDETPDNIAATGKYFPEKSGHYTELIKKSGDSNSVSPSYSPAHTKRIIATSLISALQNKGHFKLEDLCISIFWKWRMNKIGDFAALYQSVNAACEFLDSIGIKIKDYSIEEAEENSIHTHISITEENTYLSDDEIIDGDLKPHSEKPYISEIKKCKDKVSKDTSSWIIYLPFDTSPFKLGGSALCISSGNSGGSPADITDPYYFIDCYEVVRELVEDGIAISCVTVGYGGLLYAADHLCRESGMSMDLSGLVNSYKEKDIVKILFGEIPGVIIEIKDMDYDYVDAELLLQDVAYYPLGHPSKEKTGVKVSMSNATNITGILQSLLSGQASEGED